ncbi:MAG: hypothetical protein ACYTEL_16930 [Planctomycetota bacterium]|jgi:hypothetical protein
MNMAKKTVTITLVCLLGLTSVFCSGCGELMLGPIYGSMLGGALVGGIIGHQSGEAAAGALLGAAISGTGELLSQTDQMKREEKERERERERELEREREKAREEQEALERERQEWEQAQDQEPQENQEPEGGVVVVEVTNSNGSKTPVRLTKQGDGYVGPKGEHYDRLPSEEQLWPVYGF